MKKKTKSLLIRMSEEMNDRIEKESEEREVSKTVIVIDALKMYFEKKENEKVLRKIKSN